MKSIKKISLVALATVLSISFASAQVGIQAGYSSSKFSKNEITLNGFYVGPVYNMSIQGPFSLQYGLLYTYLTAKNDYQLEEEVTTPRGNRLDLPLRVAASGFVTNSSSTITAHRLDLPVRLAATFPLGNGISAFVFGGPNFNFGISQVQTNLSYSNDYWGMRYETNGEDENFYKIEMEDGKKRFSPFDIQLGAGAGLQFNQLSLRFSYDWGMLDRDNSAGVWKNNDMKVGIAYNF